MKYPRAGGGALLLCLFASPVLAYVVPGDFILHRAAEQWKDSGGLVLERQVTRAGSDTLVLETIYLKGGQVRVDSAGQSWVYSAGNEAFEAEGRRPGLFDAIFLQPQGRIDELAHRLGIDVDVVDLERLPTPEASLPFRVLFRIGAPDPRASRIDVEKDRWYLHGLQLHSSSPEALWRAEYEDHGTLKELPPWLPGRITVFKDGELFERIRVMRRLNTPIKDGTFKVAPRKPPPDER